MTKQCDICTHCVSDNNVFTCRRYPPQVSPMQAQNQMTGEVSIQAIALPVNVTSDYLCGEFKEISGLSLVE